MMLFWNMVIQILNWKKYPKFMLVLNSTKLNFIYKAL